MLIRLLSQCLDIIESLQQIAEECSSEAIWKASWLLHFFEVTPLSCRPYQLKSFTISSNELSISLQAGNTSVTAVMEAVELVQKRLQTLRDNEEFKKIFSVRDEYIRDNEPNVVEFPRRRVTPQRYSGSDLPCKLDTQEDYFR